MKAIVFTAVLFGLSAAALFAQDTTQRLSNGVRYEIVSDAEGPTIQADDYIRIAFALKQPNDTVIASTDMRGGPLLIKASNEGVFAGGPEFFSKLSEGDSAHAYIPAVDMFKGMSALPDGVDSSDFLTFSVKVIKAGAADAWRAQEQEAIQNYLKTQENTFEQDSGVYYHIEEAGQGPQAKTGDTVAAHFVMKNIEGQQLLNTRDMEKARDFVLGQDKLFGPNFTAHEKVLAKLKKGGKATLVAPSAQAFGEEGQANLDPFMPVVMEIELVKVVGKPVSETFSPTDDIAIKAGIFVGLALIIGLMVYAFGTGRTKEEKK